jgi:pimeloyl-ACP methyl ester carboxylesterase
MTPLFFGPQDHQVFGVMHMPEGHSVAQTAVLLCCPFGQEAIRTHRLYRVLADRLSRLGISTLRFDYFGTGDSSGDDMDVDLESWALDIHLADQELRRLSGLQSIVWMGARLGATAALHAARDSPPTRLVLWDPVLNGAHYLRKLQEEQTDRLGKVFRSLDSPWLRWTQQEFPGVAAEAGGFPIPESLYSQLAKLAVQGLEIPLQNVTTLIADTQGNDWQALELESLKKSGPSMIELPATFSWAEHEAHGGSIVPAAALQCLLKTLGS